MMEHEEWLKAIVNAAKNIASLDYQEKYWFRENKGTEWADEVFLRFEDLAFDMFFERYSSEFSSQQMQAWKSFQEDLACYEEKLPRFPDGDAIIEDPEWRRVRETALRFVAAFERKQPEPSLAGQK